MSKTNKIVILIAIILIIILGIKLIITKNKADDNSIQRINTINQISTKKSNGIFEIYNTDIKTDGGSTKFMATVDNISQSKTEKQTIYIVLIDKDGNEIGTIIATIPSLEVGGTTEIVAEDLKIYNGIYDFKIE